MRHAHRSYDTAGSSVGPEDPREPLERKRASGVVPRFDPAVFDPEGPTPVNGFSAYARSVVTTKGVLDELEREMLRRIVEDDPIAALAFGEEILDRAPDHELAMEVVLYCRGATLGA